MKWRNSPPLVQRLFDGPVDIVGDIHGECGALCKLLDRLGYDGNGFHLEGRRLVFLGDLVDRGPDSPGVVRVVRHLINQGNAQCILGNHELNILRGKHKHGNHWFYRETETIRKDKKSISFQILADEQFQKEVIQFFHSLPICLERDDLIVVHAMYHDKSVDHIRNFEGSVTEAYDVFHKKILAQIRSENITDRDEIEMLKQNGNPVKVLSSGMEEKAKEKFFAGGMWRTLERMRWWEKAEYQPGRLVVIGHYWRRFMGEVSERVPSGFSPTGDDMFPNYGPTQLVGEKKNVMCVDFAAGVRYEERGLGLPESSMGTHLAALRIPEMTLHLDDGRIFECE